MLIMTEWQIYTILPDILIDIYFTSASVSGLKVQRSLLSVYNVRGYHIAADSTHRSQQFKLTNQNVHITLTMTNC